MFKKYLIIASKQDPAGRNISTQLSQFINPQDENVKFYLRDKEILEDKNFNHAKVKEFDFVIFVSKHQSKEHKKTISIHAPGNWREAFYGGETEKISPASGLFQKFLFERLDRQIKKQKLKDYDLTLEVTHHGPLIEKPCVFVEIGSTSLEWNDRRAAFTVAKAVYNAIENFKENPYREIAIGIGGGHYCPKFNNKQLTSNFAISHIIPKYAFPLKKEMIDEAMKKTLEEVDLVLLDWKGLGNKQSREQVLKVLDENHVYYKRV